MTQEAKDLLLKDLCARLPYGVKIDKVLYGAITLNERDIESFRRGFDDILVPYLRPMSSMTDEEKKEYRNFIEFSYNDYTSESKECVYVTNVNSFVDWLDKNMFDHRGLIPLGLAIDITKVNNNPYKN